MEVKIDWDRADSARWRALIDEWCREMRRDVPDVLRYVAWKFALSARAHTRPCRAKLREISDGGPHPAGQWLVWVWRQGATSPDPVRVRDPHDPIRRIKYAGAAKASWYGILRALGRPAGKQIVRGSSAARIKDKGETPEIVLENRLSYTPIIHPQIMQETAARIQSMMEQRLARLARKKALGV